MSVDAEAVRKVIAEMRATADHLDFVVKWAAQIDAALAEPAVVKDSLTADADPNAPWLTEAHTLCADLGIPPGHISELVKALRGIVERLRGPIRTAEAVDWSLTSEEIDLQFRALVWRISGSGNG